jgi:dUTP pyrophosphatase
MSSIDIEVVSSDEQLPTYAQEGDAGADLRASEEVTINPGQHLLVKTGVSAAIPDGYVGMVCSRSGLALKSGVFVLNAPGIVDSGYRGEIGVILKNFGPFPFEVKVGDRIAQLLIQKVESANFVKVDVLSETTRGDGGFGSTGTE